MLKKIIRKFVVAKLEVDYVKSCIKNGTENTAEIDETDESINKITDVICDMFFTTLKDICKCFGIAFVIAFAIFLVFKCIFLFV